MKWRKITCEPLTLKIDCNDVSPLQILFGTQWEHRFGQKFYQTQNWILLDITFSHKKVILRCPFLVCIGVNMVLVTAQSITVYGFSLIDILSIYNSVLIRKNKDERKSVFWYILLSENKLLLSRSREWEKPQIIKKHLDWSSIQI